MHKTVKFVATSILIMGVFTACSTEKNKAMEHQKKSTAYNQGYERTSYYGFTNYPHAYGYAPKSGSITDRYTDLDTNFVNNRNRDLRKTEDVGYGYYKDENFHGHIRQTQPENVTMNGYYTNDDGKTAEKITNRVKRMKQVDAVSTVVYGKDIVIAIKPSRGQDIKRLEDEVREAAIPHAGGRGIRIVTERSMYDRVHRLSDNLRDGTMTNQMNKELESLFRPVRTKYNQVVQ